MAIERPAPKVEILDPTEQWQSSNGQMTFSDSNVSSSFFGCPLWSTIVRWLFLPTRRDAASSSNPMDASSSSPPHSSN